MGTTLTLDIDGIFTRTIDSFVVTLKAIYKIVIYFLKLYI